MSASVPLSVRLPREQFTKLGDLAAAHDRSISYLVRVAVDRYLSDVEREFPPHDHFPPIGTPR